MKPLLVDTGPLVAILNQKDAGHTDCAAYAADLTAPLLTTWTVLTEAAWILRDDLRDVSALVRMVADKNLQVAPLNSDAAGYIADFLDKYADQNPQIADASLMYLAEINRLDTVFTLDRRDFAVYRKKNGAVLNMVPE